MAESFVCRRCGVRVEIEEGKITYHLEWGKYYDCYLLKTSSPAPGKHGECEVEKV